MTSEWIDIGPVEAIPERGSRVVKAPGGDIAVFKGGNGALFALRDRCPHKGGPLSQGIVHDTFVTCPLHAWVIDLRSGEAQGADKGCAHRIPLRVEDGRVLIALAALARKAA